MSIAIVAALAACASGPPIGRRDLLDFVKPGTQQETVVATVGPPFATFEGGRIMIWSIGEDAGGYVVRTADYRPGLPHPFSRYELVVVFDSEGNVSRHKLVEVHKPDE